MLIIQLDRVKSSAVEVKKGQVPIVFPENVLQITCNGSSITFWDDSVLNMSPFS